MKKLYSFNQLKNFLFFLCVFGTLVSKAQLVVQTFTYTGTIQTFTVPTCVYTMTMLAKGAQGGYNTTSTYSSGLGASMQGIFTVTPGQVLKILVGQQPTATGGNGGGGGSFITDNSNSPLLIAGAGGGSGGAADISSKHGQITTSGGQGGAGGTTVGGLGGTNGSGGAIGNASYNSGGGGGLLTNGANGSNIGGTAFVNGGNATTGTAFGGFGGGAAGSLYHVGGGGGGYSGGGGGSNDGGVGGGGGSFNAGTSQVNTAGVNTGHGIVTFSYFPGAPVTVNISNSVICTGATVSLTASGVNSYTWSTGSQQPSITVNPLSTTAYTVYGTNSNNCVTSMPFTITVNNNPTVTAITNTTSVCSGNTVTLNGAGANTYTWTGGVTNGVAFTPANTATYVVTGVNACGSATAAVTVSVNPLIVSTASSPTIICSGSPATLTAVGANTYSWQPNNMSGPSVIVSPLVSTVYTVTGVMGPCVGTTTMLLPANPIPTISAVAGTSTICDGQSTTISANGGINYTWSPGGPGTSSITASPTLSTLYTVTGDNSVGCTSSAQQVVVVNSNPNLNAFANPPFICSGKTVTLTATGNGNTITWMGISTTSSTTVTPTVNSTYTAVGTFTQTNCSTQKTVNITVYSPTPQVSPTTSGGIL